MKTLNIGPFPEGANNVAPDYTLPKDQYGRQVAARDIVNADVLNSGHVRRRAGYAPVALYSNAHSGWSNGTHTLLVRSGALYRVTSFAPYTETLLKVLTNDDKMSYVPVNSDVYCSNGTDFGRIAADGSWYAHALPTPASCGVSAAAGALPAGKYQVGITYAVGTGEEGGSKYAQLEFAVNSNITVTLPTAAAAHATHINIYLTALNGGVPMFHSQVAIGTATVVLSTQATGRAIQQGYLEPLPAGTQLAYSNGRLISKKGRYAYVSEPYNFGLYEAVRGFVEFPVDISVVAPNQTGTYFVADKTYWFAGTNPLQPEIVNDVLPYGGVPGTYFATPDRSIVGWMGEQGVVFASPQGEAEPVQAGKYAPDVAAWGTALVRQVEGVRSVVFHLTGTTTNPLARTAATGTATYCLNLDSKATSRYTSYDFNSMFETAPGVFYGLTSAGIYRLSGNTDASVEIAASVNVGKQDFKTSQLKHLPNCYVGASSDDKLELVVNTEGAEYTYAARDYSTELQQQRFDLGRGLRANWFELTIQNTSGCDFEIADFSAAPVPSQRRI